jgi:hypothetical protein
MLYAYTQDVPIDMSIYRQIRAELGQDAAQGLIVHVVTATERGLRYLDVWESQEACEHFVEQRLHPVVGRIFARMQFQPPAEEPPRQPVDVQEVWLASGALVHA